MPASNPKPKPRSTPKTKIRPFRKVPLSRIPNPDPRCVYLENERYGIKVPLQNEHGSLQGVFETSEGGILEIRFAEDHPGFPGFHVFKNDEKVGYVSGNLMDRIIRGDLRGKGVATAVFDRAEPTLAVGTQKFIRVFTQKRGVAAFFAKRGYRGAQMGKVKRWLLSRKLLSARIVSQGVELRKKVQGTRYDSSNKWHRIRVIGQRGAAKGKPIWLTIKAVPVSVSSK